MGENNSSTFYEVSITLIPKPKTLLEKRNYRTTIFLINNVAKILNKTIVN